jgi:threonine/homoserine/homoserine lactone efflux protein
VGQAIGDTLPMAVGVAISPVPIIAIVLTLGTPRAVERAGVTLGWLIGLAVAGGILLALASGNAQEDGDEPATWVSVVKLLFGVLFVLIAARTWHSRPRGGEEAAMPKWMQAIDRFGAGKAFGMGFLLSALNPKNLALAIAAAAAIAQVGISTGQEIGALAVFILIGSLSILAPLAIYLALGDRAASILGDLKDWLAANNATIMTVCSLCSAPSCSVTGSPA